MAMGLSQREKERIWRLSKIGENKLCEQLRSWVEGGGEWAGKMVMKDEDVDQD